MSANEILLKKLFNRSIDTNNQEIDELVAGLLCSLIKKDRTLIDVCTELIISNMKSKDVTHAIKTLELLQECMLKCGPEFQFKVSKNKFINELVKLVSTKHKGHQTPQEVRNKIMDILLLWTTQYPKEENIKTAYTALCNTGIQHGPTLNLNTPENRISFLNVQQEKTLKELLQSKDKGDIYKANLLIRFFVEQDNKKKHIKVQAASRIKQIEEVLDMLNDFINNWTEKRNENDKENLCIMKDIYDMVSEKFKDDLPLLAETLDECEEELLTQVIEVNFKCLDVINRYNSEILPLTNTAKDKDKEEKTEDVLSDFLGAGSANVSLPKDQMQELKEIFIKTSENPPINVSSITLLESTQIVHEQPNPNIDDLLNFSTSTSSLKDIDKISEELLKANISEGEIIGKFKRPPKKLSLNELAKSKSESKEDKDYVEQCANISLMDTLTNTTATYEDSSKSLLEMEIPNANIEAATTTTISDCNIDEIRKSPDSQTEPQRKLESSSKEPKVKHLFEIDLDIDQILPSKIKPKTILDNQELQVSFNFAANKPCPEVSVVVISTVNRSYLPLGNYQFDASAGKRCKLRLLPPTRRDLPATEPFKLPTVAIQQIMLLYNSTGEPVDITCILGYTLGDDPDVIKESILVKNLPNCD